MKIGVISDTHLSAPSGLTSSITHWLRNSRTLDEIRNILATYFAGVERIIHAGDFVDETVVEMLQEFAPLEAVHGNADGPQIQKRFPSHKILELGGFRIGLTHGDGAPHGIMGRVRQHFDQVDAIVFGHTHQPLNMRHNGILYFNPGSPTDRLFAPCHSIGMLELTQSIRGELICL
ncbi:YfcE family phosphodiesterase [candidate division KSB3 bacterium]|uniref:Phosphoesterase n=1 Tax=candidate division KSB3 bacterium TaxID=2044937 RepID=A0A2G6E7V4_9BACT|nr:MAG: YfcE family phosphodiesterase [candidate division KSB3 bacterium]PIE30277.1 MAG: YfcE family phosphodiesterase [candidate division KSB3 bacterium]